MNKSKLINDLQGSIEYYANTAMANPGRASIINKDIERLKSMQDQLIGTNSEISDDQYASIRGMMDQIHTYEVALRNQKPRNLFVYLSIFVISGAALLYVLKKSKK